jgi:hypothetical protein
MPGSRGRDPGIAVSRARHPGIAVSRGRRDPDPATLRVPQPDGSAVARSPASAASLADGSLLSRDSM